MTPLTQPTRFLELLDEMRETHTRKSKDYGSKADRLKNLRASERLGIAAALGTAVRMGDKWARIEELMLRRYSNGEGPAVHDESLIDTAKDLAVYSLLLIELLEDEARDNPGTIEFTDTSPVPVSPGPGPRDLSAMTRGTILEGHGLMLHAMASHYCVPVELAIALIRHNNNLHLYPTAQQGIEAMFMALDAHYRKEIDQGDYAMIIKRYMPVSDRSPANMREAYEQALSWDAVRDAKQPAAEAWDGPS